MSNVRKKVALLVASLPCSWVRVVIEVICCLFVGLKSIDTKGMTEACMALWDLWHRGNNRGELMGNDDQDNRACVGNGFASEGNMAHDGSYLDLNSSFFLI